MSRQATFGRNVRRLRRVKGLSQEALADLCNLHRTYIGSVERGERNVSIETMDRLAAALSVDLPELLGGRSAEVRHA